MHAVNWTRVAGTDDLLDGKVLPIEVTGRKPALHRVGDAWFCTGKGMGAPVTEALRTYAVKIEGSDVLVAIL